MSLDRSVGPVVLAACCVGIFVPGSLIFGFPGVMAQFWQQTYHVGQADIGRILFYVLAAVGLFMFFIGRLQERTGPARVMAVGAAMGGISVAAVGHAPSMSGVYTWAFFAGAASACAYLPALTVVQHWYPHRKGLVAGLVSMAFGISGAVAAPIYGYLFQQLGYRQTTLVVAIAVLLIGLAAAALVRLPQPGADDTPPPPNAGAQQQGVSMTAPQSLQTRSFWLIWITYAFVGAAGISMVVLSTHYGAAQGLTLSQSVILLTAFNVTNGLSRLISGYLSDVVGRKETMVMAFAAGGAAYWLMPHADGIWAWAVLASVIGFAFGTMFAVTAPLVGDCFGMAHFGQIFGMVFTAFGFVSGALGPWLSGYLLDVTAGNYLLVFGYLGGLMLSAAAMIWFATPATECSF